MNDFLLRFAMILIFICLIFLIWYVTSIDIKNKIFQKEDKLGVLQRAWVEDLKKYPERQTINSLGTIKNDVIKVCCLGQALITKARFDNKNVKLEGCVIVDPKDSIKNTKCLKKSYQDFGLRSSVGTIDNYDNLFLTSMNDSSKSWLEIAKFIENHPEDVFTHKI
jgi:hypothetical protein